MIDNRILTNADEREGGSKKTKTRLQFLEKIVHFYTSVEMMNVFHEAQRNDKFKQLVLQLNYFNISTICEILLHMCYNESS